MTGIESIMNHEVVTIGKTESVRDAASIMRDHGLGALVVTDGGRICGLFSERDLVNRVVAEGRDPASMTVGDACTSVVTTVEAGTPVEECYQLLKDKGFRHLPIRDAEGRPVGIVSARDFFRRLVVEVESHSEVTIEATCAKLGQLNELMALINEHR
ncbi:MAG: cyclic nucleotide-binding/CBS domain-containing protein [Myxococcota bacterium]